MFIETSGNSVLSSIGVQFRSDFFSNIPHIQFVPVQAALIVVIVVVGLQGDPFLNLAHLCNTAQNVTQPPLQNLSLGYFAQAPAPIETCVSVEEPVPFFKPAELFGD